MSSSSESLPHPSVGLPTSYPQTTEARLTGHSSSVAPTAPPWAYRGTLVTNEIVESVESGLSCSARRKWKRQDKRPPTFERRSGPPKLPGGKRQRGDFFVTITFYIVHEIAHKRIGLIIDIFKLVSVIYYSLIAYLTAFCKFPMDLRL